MYASIGPVMHNERVVEDLGFGEVHDVRGRYSVADLLANRRRRCGLYLLDFDDGLFYLGQAVDAVRRFGQHRNIYTNIVRFAFQPVSKSDLDWKEHWCIQEAERTGLPITNRAHVSQVRGKTDLDLLVDLEEQEQWRRNPRPLIRPELGLRREFPDSHRNRCRQSFSRLQALPEFPKVVRVLRHYVRRCIPAFSRTEQTFWSLSCLPSTNQRTFPRFAAVSFAIMEGLVLGWDAKDESVTWAFVTVAPSRLNGGLGWKGGRGSTLPSVSTEQRDYRSAGFDQITLRVESAWQMLDLLREPSIEAAAREMNLRLMRKGPTAYAKFHCPLLADAAFGR
jgi:hypothetical protein